MPKGDNMRRRTGTFDRETGFMVEDGYVKASQVKAALRLRNHQVWQRTLAAAGIEPVARGANGHHFVRLEDARRLVAGTDRAPPKTQHLSHLENQEGSDT